MSKDVRKRGGSKGLRKAKGRMGDHILIESVEPSVDCGAYPAKGIVGEPCVVEADILRDMPSVVIRAELKWRRKSDRRFSSTPMKNVGNDLWRGEFPLEENTRYIFTIEAWTDPFATWLDELRRRIEGGQEDISSQLAEGAAIIREALSRAEGADRKLLLETAESLEARAAKGEFALEAAMRSDLAEAMTRLCAREDAVEYAPALEVVADRQRALFGAWYEMFPRSQGTKPGVHGIWADAERRLPDIRRMGFDVVYLPPIHPIGRTNRKGPGNDLRAGPGDPGSPWAIGSEQGGHTAVEPSLGTIADFDRFVHSARELGMEVALDFAPQCSPDHPWVKEHPDWFSHGPDGSIKYAENPPKKYEDVYPLNFDTEDREGLWHALREVVLFWIGHGVKIFRVDNPHTKPFEFWRWLIESVQESHPESIFLCEAFTRPKIMKALAKSGFSQSYTYFTWRTTKWEFIDYLKELTAPDMTKYFRPNFFTNTPDILMEMLQEAGRPAFKIRLVLAATLSPSYGIYSGFELCENEAVPGTEEYKDSEKYQVKVRDWDAPGNIKDFIRTVNRIRNGNPALQALGNLTFFETDNDQVLFYGKATPDKRNVILVVVSLDPYKAHHCTARLPLEAIGVGAGEGYRVVDLLTGESWQWRERNYVRLIPDERPAHILRVER